MTKEEKERRETRMAKVAAEVEEKEAADHLPQVALELVAARVAAKGPAPRAAATPRTKERRRVRKATRGRTTPARKEVVEPLAAMGSVARGAGGRTTRVPSAGISRHGPFGRTSRAQRSPQ